MILLYVFLYLIGGTLCLKNYKSEKLGNFDVFIYFWLWPILLLAIIPNKINEYLK